MNKKVFLRQQDLATPKELDFPILIIGAGGIGSWTAFALAKMGCPNLTVLDFDSVAEHNIPSQLYIPAHKSYPKVLALQTLLEQLTGTAISPIQQAFQQYVAEEKYGSYQVIICAVDSLLQRREIWALLKKTKQFKHLHLYIDARMGGEVLRIITVDMKKKDLVQKYEDTLFTNTTPHRDICTARAIVYNTLICSGFISSIVKKYAKKEPLKGNMVLDIPSNTLI